MDRKAICLSCTEFDDVKHKCKLCFCEEPYTLRFRCPIMKWGLVLVAGCRHLSPDGMVCSKGLNDCTLCKSWNIPDPTDKPEVKFKWAELIREEHANQRKQLVYTNKNNKVREKKSRRSTAEVRLCEYRSKESVGMKEKICCGGRKRDVPAYKCSCKDVPQKTVIDSDCSRCDYYRRADK